MPAALSFLSGYRCVPGQASVSVNGGPADDLVLHLFTQLYKESGIISHANDQIAVFFRFFLGCTQLCVVYTVELHLRVAQERGGGKEGDHGISAFLRGDKLRREFKIVRHTEAHVFHIDFGHGFDDRRGAVPIHSLAWTHAVGQRRICRASIGRGADHFAQRRIEGLGQGSVDLIGIQHCAAVHYIPALFHAAVDEQGHKRRGAHVPENLFNDDGAAAVYVDQIVQLPFYGGFKVFIGFERGSVPAVQPHRRAAPYRCRWATG